MRTNVPATNLDDLITATLLHGWFLFSQEENPNATTTELATRANLIVAELSLAERLDMFAEIRATYGLAPGGWSAIAAVNTIRH